MPSKKLKWLEKYNLVIFENIDSTNLEAKRLKLGGVNKDTIIWAKVQDSGRGKYGSSWESNDGGLYFSILINDKVYKELVQQLCFVVSIAITKVLTRLNSKHKIKAKWPNDIIIENNKVGGILIEALTEGNSEFTNSIVVGIGVNVSNSIDLKTIAGFQAANLKKFNIDISVDNLLNMLILEFDKYYKVWRNEGFSKIRKLWITYAYNLNRQIKVKCRDKVIEGTFKGINIEGAILIENSEKETTKVTLGEILI